MTAYIIVFSVMFIAPFFCDKIKGKSKLVYCIIMGIIISLLFGLRSEEMGMNDVEKYYVPMFQKVRTMSFKEIFNEYPIERGNLLQLLTKLMSFVVQNEHIWLFLISLPFIICVTYAIYTYSKYPMMSYFLMFGSYIMLVNMFLLRNSLSLAFLIICFVCIQKKKWIPSLIFYILAVWVHTTAVLFGITYIIIKFRSNWKIYIGSLIVSYILIANTASIFSNLFSFVNEGYYSQYERTEGKAGLLYFTRYIIFFVIYIFLYLVNRRIIRLKGSNLILRSEKINRADNISNMCFNMMCICLIFMSLSSVVTEFYRIGMFFGFFGLIGLSNEIYECKNRLIKYSCCAFLFVVYGYFTYTGLYAANLAPYHTWLFK